MIDYVQSKPSGTVISFTGFAELLQVNPSTAIKIIERMFSSGQLTREIKGGVHRNRGYTYIVGGREGS
jgi:Mn-dependent DtxR family transcriptional regulator